MKWRIVFLLFMVAGTVSAAWGATETNDAVPEAIGDMVVTAEKREKPVQDVPASITAFSQFQLEDAGIADVQDVASLSPNVHMKQGASTNLVIIRGISNDADFIHSTTGLYVDDIAYSLNFMHNPDLFDIERIEVLRGPQGTLYGRNSESGVINIITRQPGNDVAGKVFAEIGAYDPDHGTSMSYRGGLSLSGPIVENKLFLGLVGEYETSDGYIKNSFTGSDEAGEIEHKNGRLSARWVPSNQLEIVLSADILDVRDGNGNKRFSEGRWASATHEIVYDTDHNVIDTKGNGQTLKMNYHTDDIRVLSITGRRFYENQMLRDSNLTPIDAGVNDLYYSSDLISQELRVMSADDGSRLQWLGGLYLFKETNDTDLDMPTLGTIRNSDVETYGYALFGEETLTLGKRLHLTAGLRIGFEDLEAEMHYTESSSTTFKKSFDDTIVLPKFSIAYDLTPDFLTYLTVARGYNSGGFNTAYATSADNFAYDAEYTWNYEAGIKSAWFDRRLTANLALFYIAIDDKQVAQYDGASDSTHILNAAEADSLGFEFELRLKPAAGFDLFAGVGYTRVVFDQWQNNGDDYADKEFPNAPEVTGMLGVQYRSNSGLFGRISLNRSSGYYSDAANTQKLDGRTLVNLRVGYETESYDIKLWCKNLFNEEYQTMGFARRFDQVIDGAPRMFGITLTRYL